MEKLNFMKIERVLSEKTIELFNSLYNLKLSPSTVQITKTRKDFEGDYSIIIYPLLQYSKKSPVQTGEELGNLLVEKSDIISNFQIVKGYLNVVLHKFFWISMLEELTTQDLYEPLNNHNKRILIEYSSPNTNKPLHLGHIRNILLGYSLYRILKYNGYDIKRVNIVNDRGIHICKSMLAWNKWGKGNTPANTGKKGDHLVGDYYVMFEQRLKEEIEISMNERFLTEKEALAE